MKHGKHPAVTLYDTTLRDGNQALGISLSVADKVHIANRLMDLGIPYVEGGWPMPSNPVDMEFYAAAVKTPLRTNLAAFGSTRRRGMTCAKDSLLVGLVNAVCPRLLFSAKPGTFMFTMFFARLRPRTST